MRLDARRVLAVVMLVCSGPALANSAGAPGPNCNSCHGGGTAPTVTISVAPQGPLTAGQAVTVTVTVTTPNGTRAGFLLTANNGTFSSPGTGAKLGSGGVTHSSPKLEDASGLVTFTAQWTPPATVQPVTFTAWGNSVNFNGNNQGDLASSTTHSCGSWFVDADQDGFGGGAASAVGCGMPTAGFASAGGDCNDAVASIRPGAAETCNGLDDDCDSQIDEGAGTVWYRDQDGDTYGSATMTQTACSQPVGYVANSGDCNDASASVNPMGTEVCNGADDDCDSQIDEGLPTQTWYSDADADGFGSNTSTVQACAQPVGYLGSGGDCDDSTADIRPGATEVCNKKDDDCDGQIDESLMLATCGVGPCMREGPTCDPADCMPGMSQMEVCNGVDDNCNSAIDDGVPNATCGVGACMRTGSSCNASSCTPGDPEIESCNGVDDDCNGITDDDPEALCAIGEVCEAGACVALNAGGDGGTQMPDAGTDGGTGGDEEPAGGCAATGGGVITFALLAMAGALRRRRR